MGRWAAVALWSLAAYFAYIGVAVGISLIRSLFSGPWLGLEPEIMIPFGSLAIAAGLAWLGRLSWSRKAEASEPRS